MEESSRKENTPTTNPESSAPSTPGQLQKDNFFKRRTRRILSALRRVNSEWNCFLVRIKQATQNSYSDEELLDSLFESSDGDFFERTPRTKKCCNLSAVETQFISDFKKHNLLEAYYEANHSNINSISNSLRDMPSASSEQHSKPYQQLDVLCLRTRYTEGSQTHESTSSHETKTDAEVTLTAKEVALKERLYSRDVNLGNALWEIRRARWLSSDEGEDVEQKVDERCAGLSIKHISRDLFPRIYRDFVEKAKPLKDGKRINLEDMVVVIHSGWVHDKVWEAASKGLG